jgi:hypothetical protein
MGPATKKQFRVLIPAVLLCILLAGCSDSASAPSASAPVSAEPTVAYVPRGEVEWTRSYSSDAALAAEVENEGFLVLKETVQLTAEGKAEQIVTEAAIWADTLYNNASDVIGSEETNSLQAQAALQAMENGLFADATNTIEIFTNNSAIITATFAYQYSYEDATGEAILNQVTVTSSNDGKTVSLTYTRQADGTMAAQNGGGSAQSQIEQILGFAASHSETVRSMTSSAEMTELILKMGESALADVEELVQQEGYTFETLAAKTDLYEAGTQHIQALDKQSWEIYRYKTKNELYLRQFTRQQGTDDNGFIADLYDNIVDSSKKTDTNSTTVQRAIGTVHDGKVAAVYVTFEYGVTASNLSTYTVQAVGIDGIPADEINKLMYANSFADLLALYRTYESAGATMGYDMFAIRSNTFVRYDNEKMWEKATSSSDEAGGVSSADVDDDDLDDVMGVDTGASGGTWDDDDDLDDVMGVDTGASGGTWEDDDLDDVMGVDTGASGDAWDDEDDEMDGMMGVGTDSPGSVSGTGTTSGNRYYPYASTYEENKKIMNTIWSELGVTNLSKTGIGQYVQQEIDLANTSMDAAETRMEEVFEGR